MLFVKRDDRGRVEALFRDPPAGAGERLPADHPDVLAFLAGADPEHDRDLAWVHSDLAMARVVEDLIDVLLRNEVVSFTDLPLEAQQKVMVRHVRRDDLGYVARLFPANEDDELGD